MSLFKKKKVFLSHKRDLGNATPDAILIKESLVHNSTAKVFMDVTEDYLGSFPVTLKDKIKCSDAFVLVLPKASNYDYLCDPNNWVHKEIHYALTFKDAIHKPSRIIPVTFDPNFKFPSKEQLGEISEIADYSFIYFDTNNKESAQKLVRALGIGNGKLLKLSFYLIAAIVIITAFCSIFKEEKQIEPYHYEQTKTFVKSLNKLNSFNTFIESSGGELNKYYHWYFEEISEHRDPAMNEEFNEAYVKEYCVRLIVMAYLAFTSGDLDKSYTKDEIHKYVDLCYGKIPFSARFPISLKNKDREERTEDFETILDTTIETLNSDPRLQTIPEEIVPVLKGTLKSKLWPF